MPASSGTDLADLPQLPELLAFTCPRCGSDTRAATYGPCDHCRGQLRATVGRAAHDRVAATYEPKMNVTPNAVATKE